MAGKNTHFHQVPTCQGTTMHQYSKSILPYPVFQSNAGECCLSPTAVLCLGSATPEMVQSGSSESKASCWQSSWTSAWPPLMSWQSMCFLGLLLLLPLLLSLHPSSLEHRNHLASVRGFPVSTNLCHPNRQ